MKKNYSLKAKIAIFAACLTATSSLDAQVATTHTFSQSTGTFSAITGGTVVGGPTDDDLAYGGLNIGFQFQYNGTCYTQFGMCSNGYMTMGSVANYTGYNAISDPTADPNHIAVFSNDIQLGVNVTSTVTIGSPVATVSSTNGISVGNLISTGYGFPAGTTVTAVGANSFTASANATSAITGASVRFANGEMRYQTLGTAPNRVLVVQWLNCRKFGGTSGRDDFYNFQARLYETSNKISIIYGTMINNSTPSTYEIGLRGTTNADFNSRTTATDWLTTTTSTVNTDACALNATLTPVSGLTFNWDNATDITPTLSLAVTGNSLICGTTGTNVLTASGASTYSWSTSATTPSINPTTTVTTVYSVVGTATNNCTASKSSTIIVSNPTVTITGSVICQGSSITASGANTYSWSTGASTASIAPTVSNTYSVTGTDSIGCTGTASLSVTVNPLPTLTLAVTGNTLICGTTGTNVITATGANTYSWSTSATTPSINPTTTVTTVYSVVGTATTGCSSSQATTITVAPNPVVSAVSSTSLLCIGQTASLTASGASSYVWNTTSTSTVIAVSPTVTTSYTVTGTTNNCSASAVITQSVASCAGIKENSNSSLGVAIYPNPNNGEFTIELNNGLTKTIEVMDVTGRIVLTNTTLNDKLNMNATNLAAGVYYVKIKSNNAFEIVKIVKQ